MLSVECCQWSVVSGVLSEECCRWNVVSSMLSVECCQRSIVNGVLSLEHCQQNVVSRLWSVECCQQSVVSGVMSVEYFHLNVVSRVSSLEYVSGVFSQQKFNRQTSRGYGTSVLVCVYFMFQAILNQFYFDNKKHNNKVGAWTIFGNQGPPLPPLLFQRNL